MDEATNKRLGELLKRLAKGEVSVLTDIADIMKHILMKIGYAYYRNRADLEDAIQGLYVKLYDKAKYFRKNTNACSWIIKIFINSIKTQLSKKKREENYLQREIVNLKAEADFTSEDYIEKHLLIREIFDKLTEEERQIVIYYYWGKCSLQEVAKILHKSKTAIYNKVVKLEEKIKKLLE